MTFLKRYWRLILISAFTLLLAAFILIRRPQPLPAGYFNAPATPAPDVVDFDKAAELIVELEDALPGAVTVLANGAPILTLESAGLAQAVLQWRLEQIEIPEGESILYAEFLREIAIRHAIEGELPLSEEEAKARLMTKLCPVRVVTRSVEIERLPYKSEQTDDKRLPKGMRMVLTSGREGENVTVNEYGYIDGIREAVPVSSSVLTRPPVDERVAVGTYTASKNPGENEGEKGPEAPGGFKLKAPVSGKITANFGMFDGVMNNGLYYSVKLGDKVSAPEKGKVIFAQKRASFGFLVEIDHGGGFVTRIAPVAEFSLNIGDEVEKGQEIGIVDTPADEDADPFFYMELLINGVPYNPVRY